MRCRRPCTPYASPITSAHCALSFGTLDAVRSTTLRSPPSARYGRRRQCSRRQPGRRQQLKPYAYSYIPNRTQEAPGRRQRLGPYAYSYRTQEAQLQSYCGTEKRTIDSRTTSTYIFLSLILLHIIHIPFHVHHLAYCTCIHTFRAFLLYYYSSFKFINCCMVEVPGKCCALRVYA